MNNEPPDISDFMLAACLTTTFFGCLVMVLIILP